MGSCISRIDDELEHQHWEAMVLEWNNFKSKIIEELNKVEIKNIHDNREAQDFMFLFNNKPKILANRELINLLKNWK